MIRFRDDLTTALIVLFLTLVKNLFSFFLSFDDPGYVMK